MTMTLKNVPFVKTPSNASSMPAEVVDSPLPISVKVSRFTGSSGIEDIQIIIRPTEYADFETQLQWLESAYRQALIDLEIDINTTVWRRFLCSDLINQVDILKTRSFSKKNDPANPCAVSWIKQTPAPPSKVSLWAHHIHDPGGPLVKHLQDDTLQLQRSQLTHHWSTGVVAPSAGHSYEQTRSIFEQYLDYLASHDMTLADHVLRTWFFVQNVDTNYAGLVKARNEIFETQGLTQDTHYIASTGIEGSYAIAPVTATMDAYAVSGIQAQQIRQLSAPQHMSPTHRYGVAFERATSVSYQDRSHIFISGTASIDAVGETIHQGDVIKQLERATINIEALLKPENASLHDLKVFLVYLRDPNDYPAIDKQLRQQFPETPFEIVTAAVCRPGWLIEIEGLAIISHQAPHLPPY